MNDQQFFELAVRTYGIPPKTVEFLMRYFSRRPHTHTTDQIEGLEPAVAEIVEDVLAEEVEE